MNLIDIPVDGGSLRAIRFGDGPRLILAAHGITASAMAFGAVARELPGDWSLVALDLRGRGESNKMPGPFGMDRHAEDLIAAAGFLGTKEKMVLLGHSMGAYAALRAAVKAPDLFAHLILSDGGLPLPVPPGVDPDLILQATVGPAVERLSQLFPTEESYVDFFKAHPALTEAWNDDIVEYVRYDLTGEPGAFKSKADPEAVRADGRDLIVNAGAFGDDLLALKIPVLLMTAPRGMLGQEGGLLPQPLVEHWGGIVPGLRTELVPDTNHYTILMTPAAASLLAERLTA